MDSIQQELNETLATFQNIEKVKRYLIKLDSRLKKAYNNLEKLSKKLDKEKHDVDNLESLSVKGLFYKVLGSKEEQLEKERQEYLDAALKYNENKRSVELLEFERKTLEEKISKAPSLKKKVAKLMKQREKMLIHSNSSAGQRLINLSHKIDKKNILVREINEAILVGTKAKDILVQMDRQMAKVTSWGQWGGRRRSGGAMRAVYNKSYIDKAQQLSYEAKHFLNNFEMELRDIFGRKYVNIAGNLNPFSSFAQIFIQSLMIDWVVQQKIRNSRNNVHFVHDKVQQILQTLTIEIQRAKSDIDINEEKKQAILVS